MASTTIRHHTTRTTARINPARALTAGLAVSAAVAVWAVAVPLLGLHLIVRFGNGSPESVGIGLIIGASLIAALMGWGVLALLEKRTTGARTLWTALAIAVLVLSLSLPVTAGVAVATKAVLALMHVAVAAVLIPVLPRSSATRETPTDS